MKHLGDISKINGAAVSPVDIVTFGSPCQDLSVAGKQEGLDGSRSGLFREAVRIIKEMRSATNGKQPRFAVWENVPGAFSSNKGADFQTVLHELCKITEPKAPAVAIPKAGWPPAGQFTDVGGGSIAYRTIDAQFHGVPQRRRRIILVCDFTGQCAGNILFKPRGLPGYPAPGICEGETPAGAAAVRTDRPVLCFNGRQDPVNGPVAGALDATAPQAQCVAFAYKASPSAGGVGAAVDVAPTLLGERNDAAICLNDQGGRVMAVSEGVVGTLRAEMHGNTPIVIQGFGETGQGYWQPGIQTLRAEGENRPSRPSNCLVLQGSMIGRADENGPGGAGLAEDTCFTLTATDRHAVIVENHPQDSRVKIHPDGIVQTLPGQMGTGGGNVPLVMQPGIQTLRASQACKPMNCVIAYDCRNHTTNDELNPTLQAKSGGGQSLNYINPVFVGYTMRRLTPTECARLQGFPDWWADLPVITDMTDEAFDFWQEVRGTCAAINGKKYKPVAKKQMIRWYSRLHTDSAEYKMWGNGVALPVVRIPLHGMAELGAKTLGSLFDGSGGFPLAGLLDGIETLWASEIEPYPIAVTKWNFGGRAQLLLGGTTHDQRP